VSEQFAESALIVVDVQNDFCPGGALSVADGHTVVPPLNEYIARFRAAGRPVFASRDWHPERTRHFQEYGGVWPPHCIAGTAGAEFHPELHLPRDTIVTSKGMDPGEDSYSAFQARLPDGGRLPDALRAAGVHHIYIGGLATDYCVKSTVLDAITAGFAAMYGSLEDVDLVFPRTPVLVASAIDA